MMFKPFTVEKCKEMIGEVKRIQREIRKEIKTETYKPHIEYLNMQLEYGDGEIESLKRQMDFAKKYYAKEVS